MGNPSKLLHAIVVAALLTLAAGCEETPGSGCDLFVDTPLSSSSSAAFAVTYQVEASGDVGVFAIEYLDATGTLRSAADILLPWTLQLTIQEGGTASLSVDGEVGSGQIEAFIEADNGTTQILVNDRCSE